MNDPVKRGSDNGLALKKAHAIYRKILNSSFIHAWIWKTAYLNPLWWEWEMLEMPALHGLLDTSLESQAVEIVKVLSGCKGHCLSDCVLVCKGLICTVFHVVLRFVSFSGPASVRGTSAFIRTLKQICSRPDLWGWWNRWQLHAALSPSSPHFCFTPVMSWSCVHFQTRKTPYIITCSFCCTRENHQIVIWRWLSSLRCYC